MRDRRIIGVGNDSKRWCEMCDTPLTLSLDSKLNPYVWCTVCHVSKQKPNRNRPRASRFKS